MKSECDEKIVRLEAELQELKAKAEIKTDLSEIVDEAVS